LQGGFVLQGRFVLQARLSLQGRFAGWRWLVMPNPEH
jgi:hypothetical protein